MTEVSSHSVPALSRGSVWRRWDLHVHTPESVLGASFQGVSWDTYVESLEQAAVEQSISAIGVTDYMSIDGYKRLYRQHCDGRLPSVSLLIPNVEFRIGPRTKDGKALNIHMLVDSGKANHIEETERVLGNLKILYSGSAFGCTRSELVRFGRMLDPSSATDEEAYKFGVSQFKPDFTAFRNWYMSEAWLRENTLLAVANGKDGLSGLPSDGFSAIREEILKLVDIVFSGNPNDRDYFLGLKPEVDRARIEAMYGTRKPCLHGSDAHSLDQLFTPDMNRRCWIKADPTFEGLRQTLLEPELRVWIGPSSPQQADASRVIDSVVFRNHHGWFRTSELPLNEGLVTIIGEKGSGKTAIADLLAFASGEQIPRDSQSSFIQKARTYLKSSSVELKWRSGAISRGTLPDSQFAKVETPLVRYLSQDFVEQLCSEDHSGHKLYEAIEGIVFSYLSDAQKEGASSFTELREIREAATRTRRSFLRGQIAKLNVEIERLRERLRQRDQKTLQKNQEQERVAALQEQIPDASRDVDRVVLQELDRARGQLKRIDTEIDSINARRRSIELPLARYEEIKKSTIREITDVITSLKDESALGGLLNHSEINSLMPVWKDSIVPTILDEVQKLVDRTIALQDHSNITQSGDTNRATIVQQIEQLEARLAEDKQKQRRLIELQSQVVEAERTVEKLAQEIEDLDIRVRAAIESKSQERSNAYLEYFQTLRSDEQELTELYKPMEAQLETHADGTRFRLAIGYKVDSETWWQRADRFFDFRKTGAQATRDAWQCEVHKLLIPAWSSGDPEQIRKAILDFIAKVDPERFLLEHAAPTLKAVELYDWLFTTDHVETSYRILYEDVELEHLSPGSRGIALLVLYLLMDEDDRRPLVIDQPEGNLDNASVYSQLVPYIREAKKKRQIILITHNPNLVVATDADQVIIARAKRIAGRSYPEICYESGSLENIEKNGRGGVRDQVCSILEGGLQAFKERQGRYTALAD